MSDRGFVCLAQNNSSTNYVKLAKLQCMSIKHHMPGASYTLITDAPSANTVDNSLFDHVIVMPVDWAKDQDWKQKNDWQVGMLSPYRQTIKLEADVLITRNINHWWRMLEHQDIVLSLGCRDYFGQPATSRDYRYQFDANNLPDVYSGLMYFRRSQTSSDFFALVKQLFWTWDEVKKEMIKCNDTGSNDMIYACAAAMLGTNNATLPSADFFNFVHLKPAINGLKNGAVTEQVNIEFNNFEIRINAQAQHFPVHYHDKRWGLEILKQYEHTSSI